MPDTTGIPYTLHTFEPISLKEMDAVRLLDRVDVKYMFHRDLLQDILQQSARDYRVLTIAGSGFSRYETRYFDTPDLEMYLQHHNGKLNRHKVRFRDYVDSGIRFFEVKLKTNKGRTIKDRVKQNSPAYRIEGDSELLLKEKTGYDPSMLVQSIQVNYKRITLVRKDMTERLTLDFDLSFLFKNTNKHFPNLVIAEVKQDLAARSPFIATMQSRYIPAHSLSKYCLGIAVMNPGIKTNNFKSKLLHIQKMCHDNL
ncbi:MAG: polyphosphate polymerase domain-containing protein [Bacteroidota bacterium]